MSRFSKVSSIFGRDAFATMRYVTLLNVSEIRDISNDERKVPFKNDEYLASGTSSFRKACKSIIRDNKIQKSRKKEQNQRFALQELLKQFLAMSRYITAIFYQPKTLRSAAIILVRCRQNKSVYWLQNSLFVADIISNMWFLQQLPVWEVLVTN